MLLWLHWFPLSPTSRGQVSWDTSWAQEDPWTQWVCAQLNIMETGRFWSSITIAIQPALSPGRDIHFITLEYLRGGKEEVSSFIILQCLVRGISKSREGNHCVYKQIYPLSWRQALSLDSTTFCYTNILELIYGVICSEDVSPNICKRRMHWELMLNTFSFV